MYPLIEIQTIPIEIQMKVTDAMLEYARGTAQMEVSRDKGGLQIRSQPIRVNIDTFEARSSVMPTTAQNIQQGAQKGMQAAYQATGILAREGRMMMEAKIGESVIPELARQATLQQPVQLNVQFLPYEAIDWIGGPETVTAGVLARLEGEINGIILSIQHMEFINLVLQHMIGNGVEDYQYLTELEISALLEVGNIMISAFANAMAGLTDMKIRLTVPAFAVDMQGAIIAVPMAEFGGQSDYIMTIGADFICNGRKVPCRILLSPDVRSLNFLLKKLGVLDEG